MPDDCGCGAPNTFSSKEAKGDLERYLEDGADGTTRSLIDAIVGEGIESASVLDSGGGIGAIALELLAAGAAHVTSVDATESYVDVARAEIERRGYGDRATGRFGDFVELAPEIEPADIVTLDRVVCCDPDLVGLLGAAAGHARRIVGLVYPREWWWNRIAARALGVWGWITRDPTRWYLHQVRDIDGILGRAGFRRGDIDRTLIWQVALYVREPASAGRASDGQVSADPRTGRLPRP